MLRLQLLTLYGLFISTTAFLFGNSGCGCGPPPPACSPIPSYAQPPPSPYRQPGGCGGSNSYPQAGPIPPPPPYSIGAPSPYSRPIYSQSPIYPAPQAQQLPTPENGNNIGLPAGPLEQLPVMSFGQTPPQLQEAQVQAANPFPQEEQSAVVQRGVEKQQQQEDNKLQREAASAAGQKIEQVIEDDEGDEENVGNESAETPRGTNTTEATESDVANLKLTKDSLCNSEELRKLMLDASFDY